MIRRWRIVQIGLWPLTLLLACVPEVPKNPTPKPPRPASQVGCPHCRALLVGINDYTASRYTRTPLREQNRSEKKKGCRDSWPSLRGAVNDVTAMREMLVSRYGFDPSHIELLTDQAATREAILEAMERHLIAPTSKGDVVLFYFSGHGSQMVNSQSDEPDEQDETLVPADSRLGVPDIRDKELRVRLNRIVDRGAHLTVILDSCHSGSGARPVGLPSGPQPRLLEPDPCAATDGPDAGPWPEDRGALVLSAAQDFQYAWETRDEGGKRHGAFSLALLRAMRTSEVRESADHVFLRARARLQTERMPQEPVLAGFEAARRAPLFGGRSDHRAGKTVVAVVEVNREGKILLQGGWANGLGVGSELLPFGSRAEGGPRLRVTKIMGLSRSEAELMEPGVTAAKALEPGSLFELATWAWLQGSPLRVWMTPAEKPREAPFELAAELAELAAREQIGWVEDPVEETPTHVLRWYRGEWQLLEANRQPESLGSEVTAAAVISRLRRPGDSRLFVHLPAPSRLIRDMMIGTGTEHDAVEPVEPEDADYLLVGRLHDGNVEYAWVRPGVTQADQRSGLPSRTDWHPLIPEADATGEKSGTALVLEDAVLRLAKIRAWHHLESPPGDDFPYWLEIAGDGGVVKGNVLHPGQYCLVLRLRESHPASRIEPRYVYVFTIDGYGNSFLLFPRSGNVENRFPISVSESAGPPDRIPLGVHSSFDVVEPFGVETFFLLTSVEPIPDPWVLDYPGVRKPRRGGPRARTALEELLLQTGAASRTVRPRSSSTPMSWSIEKRVLESSVVGAL